MGATRSGERKQPTTATNMTAGINHAVSGYCRVVAREWYNRKLDAAKCG